MCLQSGETSFERLGYEEGDLRRLPRAIPVAGQLKRAPRSPAAQQTERTSPLGDVETRVDTATSSRKKNDTIRTDSCCETPVTHTNMRTTSCYVYNLRRVTLMA